MRAAIELLRPANCLMAAIAALVGMISSGSTANAPYIIAAVFLITGGGNGINDYYDREIDALNRPDRPIPSGRLKPRTAIILSLILFVAGSALGGLINPTCLAITIINSMILILYARYLKATPLVGNLAVAYLTGSTFLFGGLASGRWSTTTTVLSLLAGLATMGREIVKDIEDVEGDRSCGAKTLPIIIGEMQSYVIAAAFVLVASALSYAAPLGRTYQVIVTAANLIFIYSIKKMMEGDAHASQHTIKGAMALALVAFIAGSM